MVAGVHQLDIRFDRGNRDAGLGLSLCRGGRATLRGRKPLLTCVPAIRLGE
jgi:hypothetical protein